MTNTHDKRTSTTSEEALLGALRKFAHAVTSKMSQLTAGEPEDQLRAPFETFMEEFGRALSWNVVCTGETRLPGRIGKPDYAVHLNELLAGYVELKAPGVGATPSRFTGHNKQQWKRFKAIPNILYSDGNDWGVYRYGKAARRVVRLSGDVATEGKKAVKAKDAQSVLGLLRDFLQWEPTIPVKSGNKIDLEGFADMLAPLCGMLRDDVSDALKESQSPLVQLAKDWRQLLFPDASDEQFADAYAQTVTFALLLARSEGADPLTLDNAEKALAAEHSLLSRALQVLTDPGAEGEISASVHLLIRVIGEVPTTALTGPKDPWLYFYEPFLAAYNPKLRKDAGAYYTPVEVVHAQVRLIDDLLTNKLGKPLGFADQGVVTLDPAVGTGTYLLGVIEHALGRVEAQQGPGAVPGQATALARNLYGFENMVGPFAVSELRVSRALRDKGAMLPPGGTQVYLTDTLESPHTKVRDLPYILKPIADQHERALKVKEKVPVIVCLGNPPYDRHPAVVANDSLSPSRSGGWVRFADPAPRRGPGEHAQPKRGKKTKPKGPPARGARAELAEREKGSILYGAFVKPALDAGQGVHLHNLYNLYVYFWRWAIWKVFEHETAAGPGIVSFISASSYLDGAAFCGMREHMRRVCDEIWILDLGGEGRGTRKTENVFAIQTPVAIAVAARFRKADITAPAKVRYSQIDGTRYQKLKALDTIQDYANLQWEDCPDDWQAPFRPAGVGKYFDWPLLTDLLPWQQSGVKAGRTWVIASEPAALKRRWRRLCSAPSDKRNRLFKDSPTGRKTHDKPTQLPPAEDSLKAVIELSINARPPAIVRYAYRSFDRQYVFADARILDRPGPPLWRAHGDQQVYLTTLLNHPLGSGPAVTGAAHITDLHHFRGSYGAKEALPLYRDAQGKYPNLAPALVDVLRTEYATRVTPEEFVAYIYGVLAQPAFTARFAEELATRELRVPVTKDKSLFHKARDAGRRLLWLHTYGERFVPKGTAQGQVPQGKARCVKPVPGERDRYPQTFEYNQSTKTLHVGDGEFKPVQREVFEFEVSGLKVVQSWLKYRMKKGAGKKSSPLDDIRPERWTGQFTTELLDLLWVLEATVKGYPKQADLLDAIVKGPCFQAHELPPVPDDARKPPAKKPSAELLDGLQYD